MDENGFKEETSCRESIANFSTLFATRFYLPRPWSRVRLGVAQVLLPPVRGVRGMSKFICRTHRYHKKEFPLEFERDPACRHQRGDLLSQRVLSPLPYQFRITNRFAKR
jgi:hypothetical protein